MAFKITQKPVYTIPVVVHTPKDGGGFDASKFKAKFKRVDMAELEELRGLPQLEVQQRVLIGFDELEDDEGLVEFSDETKAALLNIPQALQALSEAFWGSIFQAKTKN